tara:strand:+ start:442 stop:576 length:135 start_codon:yes stop_codon:yes gene_type:complete
MIRVKWGWSMNCFERVANGSGRDTEEGERNPKPQEKVLLKLYRE